MEISSKNSSLSTSVMKAGEMWPVLRVDYCTPYNRNAVLERCRDSVKILCILLLLSTIHTTRLSAQDIGACEKVVATAVDAVNNHSTEELKKHLAPDFTCIGQTGAVAMAVMEQLVRQLDEHISDISKVSEQQADGTLTLVYDFNYSKKLGHKNATFVFNADNQLKQMDLLPAQVKKVSTKTDFKIPEQDVITIPIDICDDLITVVAKLNGIERKFILDSGAPSLYLNSRYFASGKGGITIGSSQGVSSGISGQSAVRIDSFDFYGIEMRDEDFLMSDLSHLLKDEEIYGLIGYQVIKDYDWLFDYENKTLTLIKPKRTATYIDKMKYTTSEVPLQLTSETSHIPFVKGVIGNTTLSLGIDCGATGNLLDISLFNKLENDLTGITTTDLRGASQETVNVKEATVKCLAIGEKRFQNMATAFNDISHLNAKWENKIDGLIGYEVLSKQKTIISIPSRKLIFIE